MAFTSSFKPRTVRTGLLVLGATVLLLFLAMPSLVVDFIINVFFATVTPSQPTWNMAAGRAELAAYRSPDALHAQAPASTSYNHALNVMTPSYQQMVNKKLGYDFPLPSGGTGLDRERCLAEAPECEWFEHTTFKDFSSFPFDIASCCYSHAGQSGMRHILTALAKELNAAGVRWWLEYGTNRAYVRYRQPNAWDDEADIGYALDDHHLLEDIVFPALEAKGFELKLRGRFLGLPGTMFMGGHTLRYKNSSWPHDMWSSSQVDLYAFYNSPPTSLWSYVRRASFNWRWRERNLRAPYDTLFPPQPCMFLDVPMSCAAKPAEYAFYETGTLLPPPEMTNVECGEGTPDWIKKSQWFKCV